MNVQAPIPGAVIVLLALVEIIYRSVSGSEVWNIRGVKVTVLPLNLVGVIILLQTQEAYNQAW